MRTRTRALFGVLLGLALALGLLPGMSLTAYAAKTAIPIDENTQTQDHIADQGWSYDAGTHTLTLSGAAIDTGFGIMYEGTADLNIVLSGTNSISALGNAIWANRDANTTISGDGSLTATSGSGSGIYNTGTITINGGTVTVEGSSDGITGSKGVTINNGTVTATGDGSCGINAANGAVTVSDGTVSAKGVKAGIYVFRDVTISGGTVEVIATGTDGRGVDSETNGNVAISDSVVAFTASGAYNAICRKVTNAVPGTGWTDVAGTTGKEDIAVSDTAQWANKYKRVQFPAVVTKFTVALAGGANATVGGGATTQAVEDGKAMAAVTYAASAGYHFEAFDPISASGVTAKLEGGKVVVSGTPTADVSITVPDAVADAKPDPKPEPDPAPAKVAKLSTEGHPGTGTLDVSWKAAKGAKSYEVQWRKKGGKWQAEATKSRKCTISGLKAGALYEVRVRAKAGSKAGAWSSVARRWLRGPSNVKTKAGSTSGSIKVSWKRDAKATGGTKVYVYAKKGGKLVKTAQAEAGKASVTVSGLKAGKRYYVRVRPLCKSSGKTYTGTLSGYRVVRAAK